MYPEQFLRSLANEFGRLASSGEEVDIKQWADKINAYLQYLKLQSQLEEQARTLKELEGKFAISTSVPELNGTAEDQPKKRGRKPKLVSE